MPKSLSDDDYDFVLQVLERTVNGILTSDQEMQELLDDQETALERLQNVIQ
jgi:hypothetical protein